jgi:carbonic anhydrase
MAFCGGYGQSESMDVFGEMLMANQAYCKDFPWGHLPMPPRRKLAVLTCMDARIDVFKLLGLDPGDAHAIRNAGGIATVDAIRSLVISHHLLDTQSFAIINHTDCGMLTFQDEDLMIRLQQKTGIRAAEPSRFFSFTDVRENILRQIEIVREHPWIPRHIPIRGYLYDVKTGRLEEVTSLSQSSAA